MPPQQTAFKKGAEPIKAPAEPAWRISGFFIPIARPFRHPLFFLTLSKVEIGLKGRYARDQLQVVRKNGSPKWVGS